jgi:hypothetical protein
MSTTPAVPASEAPSTPKELAEWELSPGDAAAHVFDEPFYIVARTHAIEGVIEAAPLDELRDDPEIDTGDDAIAAVEGGSVAAEVVPERFLVPLMEEFLEAHARGEWSGVRDYLHAKQEVSD